MIAALLAPLVALAAPSTGHPPQPVFEAPQVCDGSLPARGDATRAIPVRVRLPAGRGPHPVILFSHGLGGSVEAGTRWAAAWTAAGFAVIHIQHPGSDALLWRGLKGQEALAALRKGMDAKQFIARIGDVRTVLDAVGGTGRIGACPLSRLDAGRIGIAGHSFGAQTVQAMAGQQFRTPGGLVSMADPRIRAAIAFSPAPAKAEPDESAFGKIAIPFLSVTGTRDEVPGITNVKPQDRTRPFHAMPPGSKYLLVLDGADHMVFSGGEQRRPATSTDTRIERVVTETSVAFWKAMLEGKTRQKAVARPASLGPKDLWLAK
jgi:predicted dienelactone hydrolase